MHKLSIGGCNADEISVEADQNDRFSNHGEKEILLALLGIVVLVNFSHSRVEIVFLVDGNEIDDIPNAEEEN